MHYPAMLRADVIILLFVLEFATRTELCGMRSVRAERDMVLLVWQYTASGMRSPVHYPAMLRADGKLASHSGSEAKPRVLNESPVDSQTPRRPSPQTRPLSPTARFLFSHCVAWRAVEGAVPYRTFFCFRIA